MSTASKDRAYLAGETMQTVNFNCSFCGKLMAVGLNLLGRNVRCPHCKQVIQAPVAAKPPSPVQANSQSPTQAQESQESIFGEMPDEDVFGTRVPQVQMPTEVVR